MEPVRTWNGVLFVNDSKGTNPDSTMKALSSYDAPIVLIAGGRNKGVNLVPLAEMIAQTVKTTIVIGEAKEEFCSAFATVGYDRYQCAENLEQAVHLAAQAAQAGDVVLLSPACTSWDMFRSFEERGDLFRIIVLALNEV